MTDKEAKNKALIIYDLLGDIRGHNIYYWNTGALSFDFRIPSTSGWLSCLVKPDGDKYKIKISTPINIATTVILHEVNDVEENELYDTMISIIEYLNKEWIEWNKEWKGSWSGYPKGKVIKYDDHGYIVSIS